MQCFLPVHYSALIIVRAVVDEEEYYCHLKYKRLGPTGILSRPVYF
jgi:hypothetical protein